MKRFVAGLVTAAGLGVVAWLLIAGTVDGDVAPRGVTSAIDDLPDTPAEWQGRIDYRALDRQLEAMARRPEMAGLAVAIVEEGKLRFVGTYGLANVSTGAPVTAATMFRWASLSKTAASALASVLASEGKIALDRPIADWPTSLRLPNGAQARVTFGQLLAQQTGLTKNAYDGRLEGGESPQDVRARLAQAPLQCEPGTCHSYQNIAYDTASEILTEASNRPFADAVVARFFGPLGMTSAAYGKSGLVAAPDWARPHDMGDVRPVADAYWGVPAAAGVESNIVDLAIWMQAMMGARPDVVSPDALAIMHAPRVPTAPLYGGELRAATRDAHYGLGWRSFVYDGHRLEGHSGALDGYRATMIYEPATRTGVVAMWNSEWGRPFRIPFAVIDSYHRKAGSGWLDLTDVPQPDAPRTAVQSAPQQAAR